MKKILITGADGFTGRYLADTLSRAGYEVHGLVRIGVEDGINGVTTLHNVNLSESGSLVDVLQAVQPTHVVHLAAISFVAHGDAQAIYKTNVVGTRNLLEALLQANTPLKSVLLASSANIYGNAIGGVLTENTPAAPANDYAVSKLTMEYLSRLYSDRLPITIVRPFNYTGVGQRDDYLIPKIVSHISKRAAVIELGNLEIARDFSDVRSVVHQYTKLLETPAAVGQTFNICSGLAMSLNDVLGIARELSGHNLEVRVNPAFVRQNEVKILVGSSAYLESIIGSVAPIAFRETLRWMLEARA